jgi:hypothetical protein
MLVLKHLKTPQHVSTIIQIIIIRKFVGSLLKLLNLKFCCQRLHVVMRQHNVWCKCVTFRVVSYVGLQSNLTHHTVTLTRTSELPDDDLNDDRNMLECF